MELAEGAGEEIERGGGNAGTAFTRGRVGMEVQGRGGGAGVRV